MHDDIGLMEFVIPGLTKPAPYLIRGNPVLLFFLVPRFRGDDVWIPAGLYPVLDAGGGMTSFVVINDVWYNILGNLKYLRLDFI